MNQLITKAQLKRRGWTDKLIKTFNVEHDSEAINPYNDTNCIKLYYVDKIIKIENSSEFKGALSMSRGLGTEKLKQTLAKSVQNMVDGLSITFDIPEQIGHDKLIEAAYNHYQQHFSNIGVTVKPMEEQNKAKLRQLAVNYVIYQRSNFNALATAYIPNKSPDYYALLKERFTKVVMKRYPFLNVQLRVV